jgi:hypothetical protein
MQKSLVNVQSTLVPNNQPLELVEPGKGALHNPAVPAQPLAALYSSSGNSRSYASLAQRSPAPLKVVPFVSVQLGRPLPSSPAKQRSLLDRLDSINHVSKSVRVVNVGRCADYGERNSLGVDHNMALRTRFALICGVRPCTLPPFLAGTLAESTAARDQSILPASPSLSNSTWCKRSHTPAACKSLSRRQQVLPLPQPISGGKYDQGKPVLSTNMMPVRAARFDTRGRPPFGLAGSGGKSGSITSHSPSVSNGFAIS